MSEEYKRARTIPRLIVMFFDMFICITFSFSITSWFLPPIDSDGFGKFFGRLGMTMLTGILCISIKDFYKGKSIGKMVAGIKVVKYPSIENAEKWRLALRSLPILFWPVEVVMVLTNAQRRRVGDYIAKTIVIKDPDRYPWYTRVSLFVVGCCVIYFAQTYTLTSTLKKTQAYVVAVKAINEDQKLREKIGNINGFRLHRTGGINMVNGEGSAIMGFDIDGNLADTTITIILYKELHKDWEIKQIQ